MLSDPPSPKPSRWILEMFAPDIPAWYRAFNELERKPLDALEQTLVYDFDRYLRRKGYLTERQVEVLRGIARKHNVPLPPIPPVGHHSESRSQEASALLKQIRIPELEKPENAKWLALLMDTEGSLGWRRYSERKDRMDEKYRYEYIYRVPYISLAMNELESKETVDEGARLVGSYAWTSTREGVPTRQFGENYGRALSAMRYMHPYLVKYKRLATLCTTLFRHRTFIPTERFDKTIETLFGKHLSPKEANIELLKMTENQFNNLIKKAQELTNQYLK